MQKKLVNNARICDSNITTKIRQNRRTIIL